MRVVIRQHSLHSAGLTPQTKSLTPPWCSTTSWARSTSSTAASCRRTTFSTSTTCDASSSTCRASTWRSPWRSPASWRVACGRNRGCSRPLPRRLRYRSLRSYQGVGCPIGVGIVRGASRFKAIFQPPPQIKKKNIYIYIFFFNIFFTFVNLCESLQD